MDNELVRYSRAGDVFHYRWGARRCIRMIHPKSPLDCIVVEGSKEQKLAGEYTIDIVEYSNSVEGSTPEIAYFQLKHSTVRKEQPFRLSDLKNTIEGFAKRYSEHHKNGKTNSHTITFSIITNRLVDGNFKCNLRAIVQSDEVNNRFRKTIENYTNLAGKDLVEFCASISLVDKEGDYIVQRQELQTEISNLVAGTVDTPLIDSITNLVQEKALPHSDGKIIREDILKRFGVTSERDLYPAPPEFEKLDDLIHQKQHLSLLDFILNTSTPVIIHAAGGVGKSVFAHQIVHSLPIGSFGIVYDCFGGGRYLNRSESRHRHRDALVEIANELASHGLCDPLIVQSYSLDDDILRKFLERIKTAVECLRDTDKGATLIILIDAADNAEMAAEKFGESCFAHELLRETLPDGCHLVMLCRTERISLLQPLNHIPQQELEPFSQEETLAYLRRHFPQATDADGLEFYRLTNNGNPRVQANALGLGFNNITETLIGLGPFGTTVEKQIATQLDTAISNVKEKLPVNYQRHIDAICLGLANLPPLIPLNVLVAAAKVDEATVKSFITDLGRPLWISDDSVQFRDEPTETWFREKFSATIEQIASYIEHLKPLANRYTYVAEALPSLFLQAMQYDELICLALSDDLLPKDNPIDERNVRVFRLRFAFRAALNLKRHDDAIKLALRAGEELAGDKRQQELLKKNVDLIAPLQNGQRVQELAYRRILRSEWNGSENVYSAALLSCVSDFKGEARGYLRAAMNWTRLYFEERESSKDEFHQDSLTQDDIVELVFAHFNLFGTQDAVDLILNMRPPEAVYGIAQKFIHRLVDWGKFDVIEEISLIAFHNLYLMSALAYELLAVGHFPSISSLEQCLDLFIANPIPTSTLTRYNDLSLSSVLSLIEACAARNLPKEKILLVLGHYFPVKAARYISSDYQAGERNTFLRATSLRNVLSNKLALNLDELLPDELVEKKRDYQIEQDVREFKEVIASLLPWHIVRSRVLLGDLESKDVLNAISDAAQHSGNAKKQIWRNPNSLSYEISSLHLEILKLWRSASPIQVDELFANYLNENQQIGITSRLAAVRSAYRLDHLSGIGNKLEGIAYNVVAAALNEDPDTRAEWYIDLARAVFPQSNDDAAAYFDYAIEAVSRFGDEIVRRWEAVVAVARRSTEGKFASSEMAYRFIRCAELVGDNVAREKYIDRNEAVRVSAKLSPVSALAALSRWRDRSVGRFGAQVVALADEIVKSNFVFPSVGWSLSAFFEEDYLDDFALLCIEKETSKQNRQYILKAAIRSLRLNDAPEICWLKLKQAAQQYAIENDELNDIQAFYAENPQKVNTEKRQNFYPSRQNESEAEQIDWENLLGDLDLLTDTGINQAQKRFRETSGRIRNYDIFWQNVFERVANNNVSQFLCALVTADDISIYDVERVISHMPTDWRKRASLRRNWEIILRKIGRHFAVDLTRYYTFGDFLERIGANGDAQAISSIREGILDGLCGSTSADSDVFWGFVQVASKLISPEQASCLLDFALMRFELHIDDDYADGCWSNWLNPPENVSVAFAGFVWAALGSPEIKTRWRAAHCVRKLCEAGCTREIDALLEWMKQDKAGAFGSCKYPFYNLHARLYLLMALARVSLDFPQLLKPHFLIFHSYSLESIDHVLIQKFSADIALNIEKAFPDIYCAETVNKLHQVGISQLPVREIKNLDEKLENYCDVDNVDMNIEFHFGWDFDQYWFEPLGEVFGISHDQVRQLAVDMIIHELNADYDGTFSNDPRAGLWQSSWNQRETHHDHGDYPQADNYAFYLSYHALFIVASKLLKKLPVVYRRGWCDDKWAWWLHRHWLTQDNGYWLADRRDPAPLLRPSWVYQEKTESWCSEIKDDDFLKALFFKKKAETWLNVFGAWSESDTERDENYNIFTAFVLPTASQSLLHALTTCPDPHDFKLPEYQEEQMEVDLFPFELKGWIYRDYPDACIDGYDPFAARISFPPYKVGQSIVERLNLHVDREQCFL